MKASFKIKRKATDGTLKISSESIRFSGTSDTIIDIPIDQVYACQLCSAPPTASQQSLSPMSTKTSASQISMVSGDMSNTSVNGTKRSSTRIQKISQLVNAESDGIIIFTLDLKKSVHRTFTFLVDDAAKAVEEIRCKLTASDEWAPKRVLVLINPFGGTKQAMKVYEKQVEPMLKLAQMEVTVQVTEYEHHATEIGKTLKVGEYDAVATVSGDGLMNEIVNGIMQRSDWKEAIKVPLALIPGGSSNAMAKSISTTTPELATLNLIQGHTRKFDLFGIKYMQSDKLVYGFLELLWTFVADVDIESETMRWAGSNRFIVAAVFRLLRLRRYTGKLSFLPATKPRTESETLMRFKDLKTVPEDWKTVSTVFTYFMAMNAPWAASD